MRAVLVKDGKGPVENLYLGEAPTPTPGPGQVLVKACIHFITTAKWQYPPPAGSSSILGVEFAGHISALGADVSDWKVDDEVLGLAGGGAYAEFIVLPSSHILRKPSHLSWAEAASIPENFLTGQNSKTVTATASTKEKLDWLLNLPLGPTHVANYKTEDFTQTVKRATDNKGADVVIDFVGKAHWKQNIESLAVDGHMTMLALLSGGFCL
ncbi:hypothetical protein C0993_006743 [Termitomyces sp. T159_Od127]|nr:hypothetical protein C0993_006743 [Termitomyces sp. T159_Od127]